MTVKEFLETIGFHYESNKFEKQNNLILNFNIEIYYQHNNQYPYDDQILEHNESVKFIDIDNNQKTITLKGKN